MSKLSQRRVVENMGLAWTFARKLPKFMRFSKRLDIATLALVRASRSFRSTRGAFSSYVWKQVKGQWQIDVRQRVKESKLSMCPYIDEARDLRYDRRWTAQERKVIDVLLDGLSKLKPKHQLLLQKRFYDDLTLEEVGELMGVTRQAVEQAEKRALRELKLYVTLVSAFE